MRIDRQVPDDMTINRLGEEVAEAAVAADRAIHELLTRVRRFDAAGGWHRLGAKTMSHWLSHRLGTGLGAGRELARVAQALGALPRIDAALQRGELSYCKVRAMTRIASVENEELLLEYATQLTGAQLEKLCSRFRGVLGQTAVAVPEAARPDRYVRHYPTEDGMVRIVLQLHADEAALVLQAIEAARRLHAESDSAGGPREAAARPQAGSEPAAAATGDVSAETSGGEPAVVPGEGVSVETSGGEAAATPGEDASVGTSRRAGARRPCEGVSAETSGPRSEMWPSGADGAVLLAERFLATAALAAPAAPGGPRFEVTVLVDEATLAGRTGSPAALGEDLGVSAETARRLACDAAVVPVAVGPRGEVRDVGRRTRTIPSALQRALRLRDGCCRFPGCTNRHFVDGHHVKHWAQGGETKLPNLVTMCGFHHRLVHEGGFGCTLEGECFVFTRPDGTRLDEVPPRPWAREDGLAPRLPPVPPEVRTTWDGWPMSYGLAIDGLLELGSRPLRARSAA